MVDFAQEYIRMGTQKKNGTPKKNHVYQKEIAGSLIFRPY